MANKFVETSGEFSDLLNELYELNEKAWNVVEEEKTKLALIPEDLKGSRMESELADDVDNIADAATALGLAFTILKQIDERRFEKERKR